MTAKLLPLTEIRLPETDHRRRIRRINANILDIKDRQLSGWRFDFGNYQQC